MTKTTEVKSTEVKPFVRVLRLEVYPTNKEDRIKINDAIRRCRFICSQAIAVQYCADLCAAIQEKKSVRPDNEQAQSILGEILQKRTGAPLDQFIKDANPTWKSDLIQECRRKVESALTAKDPEKATKAGIKLNRRFLLLNGARELPSFKNIGLPIKHYVDPSGKTTSANFKWLDGKGSFSRSFSLSWDNAIGRIPFMIAGKRTKSENGNISYGLDPQQIMILKQIQSGKFTMCTSNLMEYDGEFTFLLAYHFIPQQKQDLDPKRVLELAWNPEECDPKHLFTISLKQGLEREVDRRLNDYLDASAVVPQLFSLRAQRNKLLGCLRACGSRFARTPEQGSPPSREHFSKRLDALSERRNNFVKHWNHRWTAQVIQIAIQWNCGTIMVMNLPSCKPKNQPQTSPETIGIINQAWQWSDFKFKLDYKAQEKGIQTSYVDDDSAGEQVKAIA